MASTTVDRYSSVRSSLAIKAPCKVATTANITLSGEQTIDGTAVVENDRVLVWQQTDGTKNGIYIVSTGTWTRAPDFDGSNDVTQGTRVGVTHGSYAGRFFYVTTEDPITVGTTSIAMTSDEASVSVGYSWVNAKNRGLDFTDSDTNAAANLTLMNSIIAEGAAIWFDEGDPWFSGKLDFSDKLLHIKGMGKGHTRLHFSGPGNDTPTDNVGIYAANTTGANGQIVLDGFTLYAEYDSNGATKDGSGFWLEQQTASGAEDGIQMTNVHVRGVTGGANQLCWNVAYRILGYGVSRFTSVSCSLKENVSEAGFIFDDSTVGSQASINPSLYKCSLYSAKYGVKFLGLNEGGRLVGCNLQEVNWGVYKDHGANNSQPFLSLINTHINANLGGLDIRNGRYVFVDDCNWYAKVDSSLPSGLSRTEFYFIRSIGPTDGASDNARKNFGHIFSGSKFKANAVGTGPAIPIYGIYANYTYRSIVTGCQFESCTKPIHLTANTSDWYIPDTNQAYVHPQDTTGSGAAYTEPTDFVSDFGSNNIINHKGFQRGAASLYDADGSHYVGIQAPATVTTAHTITIDGQNANRTLSLGGNLSTNGDLATNGNVDISTYAATILDDETSIDVRRTIDASRSAWVVEDSATASGGASLVFTDISQNYREMGIYFDLLSHDDAASQHFRVEISYDNGSTYHATPVALTANTSAAGQMRGLVGIISNYSVANTDKIVMSNGSAVNGTGAGILVDSTAGGIDAIRITASAGNLDAGTVYVLVR